MFEADSQNFASAPSAPRGFTLNSFRPGLGGDDVRTCLSITPFYRHSLFPDERTASQRAAGRSAPPPPFPGPKQFTGGGGGGFKTWVFGGGHNNSPPPPHCEMPVNQWRCSPQSIPNDCDLPPPKAVCGRSGPTPRARGGGGGIVSCGPPSRGTLRLRAAPRAYRRQGPPTQWATHKWPVAHRCGVLPPPSPQASCSSPHLGVICQPPPTHCQCHRMHHRVTGGGGGFACGGPR